jgi:HTH-type transcriptional regulator/antitoxin MqsA
MTKTRIHPETGILLRHGVRVRRISYKRVEGLFGIPGWWPAADGDGILSGPGLKAVERALDQLKAEAAAGPCAAEVRRIRQRLRLSRRRADEILVGESGTFRKYESGEFFVGRTMANLLRLLDDNPSLLKQLTAARAA